MSDPGPQVTTLIYKYVVKECKRTLKYDACKVLLDLEVQDGIGNGSNGKVLRTLSLTHLASCVVKYTCHLEAFPPTDSWNNCLLIVFGTFKGCQTMPCLAPSKLSAAQKLGLGCMVRIECIDKRDHKKGNKTHQWPSACPQSDGFDELQLAQKGTTQHQIYTDICSDSASQEPPTLAMGFDTKAMRLQTSDLSVANGLLSIPFCDCFRTFSSLKNLLALPIEIIEPLAASLNHCSLTSNGIIFSSENLPAILPVITSWVCLSSTWGRYMSIGSFVDWSKPGTPDMHINIANQFNIC